jgi:hypothetical protein
MFSTILLVPLLLYNVPNKTIQLKISFDIPVRGPFSSSLSSEPPNPMLSIVECGSPSTVKRTL